MTKAKATSKGNKGGVRSHTHLEKLVSKTEKLKVEELLDLYKVYDELVIEWAFRHLLFPYTRFARIWLRDQARDLLAGTDRNRLILTSRYRKESETAFDELSVEEQLEWAIDPEDPQPDYIVKPRHTQFVSRVFSFLAEHSEYGSVPTMDEIESLGVSRLVFDDMASYFTALMNSYPQMVAEYTAAMASGNHEEATLIDAYMRTLETEIGIKREHAWYVAINLRSIYDQIEKMIETVTMAYARLLFRFAHRLRGVTTTEENFSAGYEGMIRAARNYDPVDGSSFTAHCQWWVRSSVLQRQRQASVILLPTTTWYQLNLLRRGEIELSHDRVSDLKERAEMFYANSSNASKASQDSEEVDDFSFESIYVSSPDANIVLGDSILHAQSVEEGYETRDTASAGRDLLEDVFSLLHNEDPALIFPVLLWALNSGIDATMLAEITGPIFLSPEEIEEEKVRHQQRRERHSVQSNPFGGLQPFTG